MSRSSGRAGLGPSARVGLAAGGVDGGDPLEGERTSLASIPGLERNQLRAQLEWLARLETHLAFEGGIALLVDLDRMVADREQMGVRTGRPEVEAVDAQAIAATFERTTSPTSPRHTVGSKWRVSPARSSRV